MGGKGALILALVLLCHVTGLLLFCKGFLLKRIVIPEDSQCDGGHHNVSFSCNKHPRVFKRVLWVLIDALRYDFMLYDDSLDPSPPPHRNRMSFVRDLLRDKPRQARLYKLVADPPTTTMQRLKALTTGSLPTFVDIGSNFNSYAITEDSLVKQCHRNNRKITFIGDDTWLGLYPSLIDRVFPFPSLNVKDFDTVDEGVRRHLVPELAKQEAEFVIAHMLGVDHCGHTHGPAHSCMSRKLSEADDLLE